MMNEKKIGVILSYLAQIISILTSLLYTPIMLKILGQSEYGLYQLVASVVAYLSLLGMGFSASYLRFYSRAKAENDEENIYRINGMFLTIFLVIAVLCVICGSAMCVNIRSIFAEGLTEAEYAKARVLMIILVLNMAISFPNNVFDCIIVAHERFFFQKTLNVLQVLLNPFIALPLLLLGYGSVGMVCVTTGLTIAKSLSNIWFCIHKLKIRFRFNNFKLGMLSEMWAFTFFIFLNSIIEQINWNVDKLLLGRFCGTIAISIYAVGSQINNMYMQLSGAISGVFVPQVYRIVSTTDSDDDLTELFIKIGRIQALIMILILTGFILFGRDFLRLWVGDGYRSSYEIALILMIPAMIPQIQNIGIEIQRARNKHQVRSIVYAGLSIGNLVISIPLTRHFGAVGAAMGTGIALLLGNVLFMNWYYKKGLHLNIRRFWKSISGFVLPTVLSLLIGVFISKGFSGRGWGTFFVGAMMYTGVYSILCYFFGCNQYEKGLLKKMMKKVAMK